MQDITEFAKAMIDGTDQEINKITSLLKKLYDIAPASKPKISLIKHLPRYYNGR